MPNWGSNAWMSAPPTFSPGVGVVGNGVVITQLHPLNGAVGVPPSTPIRFTFYIQGGGYTPRVLVNEEEVITPNSIHPDYVVTGRIFAGRTFIAVARRTPFPSGLPVQVAVSVVENTSERLTTATWSFTPEATTTYVGNRLLAAESLLLQPMTHFLELEPLRVALLDQVLSSTGAHVPNRQNIAARVLYQLAFESEISAVLNPYIRPNASALATVVPNKRATLEIVDVVSNYAGRIDKGLQQLFEVSQLPREYRNNFTDYLGSLLYNYRVSAAAVLLFLARAIETAAATTEATPVASTFTYVLADETDTLLLDEDDTALES